MAVDGDGLITDFVEKPADPPPMPGDPTKSLASMGIYIFDADYLYAELARATWRSAVDARLRRDIIPNAGAHGPGDGASVLR